MGFTERPRHLVDVGLRLLLGDHALRDEAVGVDVPGGRLPLDALDHQRLRVRSIVLLVVPEPPVPDQVDHEVVAEFLAVCVSQSNGRDRGLWIVRVDVDDRDVEALGEVARIPGRAALGRIGRVPDLVVRDQVQGAAGAVPLSDWKIRSVSATMP